MKKENIITKRNGVLMLKSEADKRDKKALKRAKKSKSFQDKTEGSLKKK